MASGTCQGCPDCGAGRQPRRASGRVVRSRRQGAQSIAQRRDLTPEMLRAFSTGWAPGVVSFEVFSDVSATLTPPIESAFNGTAEPQVLYSSYLGPVATGAIILVLLFAGYGAVCWAMCILAAHRACQEYGGVLNLESLMRCDFPDCIPYSYTCEYYGTPGGGSGGGSGPVGDSVVITV